MCIYIQIYANKPCLCEAFYIKTMVFLCGDMQALLISERQNQNYIGNPIVLKHSRDIQD